MASSVAAIEHTDFVALPVTDMERSVAWYRDVLGLEQTGDGGFPEFRLGDNNFLYLLSLEAIGQQFTALLRAECRLQAPQALGRDVVLTDTAQRLGDPPAGSSGQRHGL